MSARRTRSPTVSVHLRVRLPRDLHLSFPITLPVKPSTLVSDQRDQFCRPRLPRLEARRRAGDVQPAAVGLLAVKLQRRIGLEEVVVRTDLNGPIACVRDRDGKSLSSGVDLELARDDLHLARNHFFHAQ